MSLVRLARFIAAEPDFDARWRLVVEFLKEYHREPAEMRQELLAEAPGPTGDERWDESPRRVRRLDLLGECPAWDEQRRTTRVS
jgi:hypothetical protein